MLPFKIRQESRPSSACISHISRLASPRSRGRMALALDCTPPCNCNCNADCTQSTPTLREISNSPPLPPSNPRSLAVCTIESPRAYPSRPGELARRPSRSPLSLPCITRTCLPACEFHKAAMKASPALLRRCCCYGSHDDALPAASPRPLLTTAPALPCDASTPSLPSLQNKMRLPNSPPE